jgi:uncharacterized repeat protein (TIGR03803 family)
LSGGTAFNGTVFRVSTKSNKETVLHSFTGQNGDGSGPISGVIADSKGNLYGTTETGGDLNCGQTGCGIVFKLDHTGKETILHMFKGGADGELAYAAPVIDGRGNLYGTTYMGGADGNGIAYKLTVSGKESILHTFLGGTDGANPADSGLVADANGNGYGTTFLGGTSGVGTVYKISSVGDETVFYSFAGYPNDGEFPDATLIIDRDGNLYGTTSGGGTSANGTIFELDRNGQETLLHNFDFEDGYRPLSGLIRDASGNLYGTASEGGVGSCGGTTCGTVFMFTPNRP